MQDAMEPMIEKYRQELLAFSRKYPRYTPQPEPEPEPQSDPEPDEEPERILPAGQLVRDDFPQQETSIVMNAEDRLKNVAQREKTKDEAPIQPPMDNEQEQQFAENGGMYPPYLDGSIEQFPSEEDFMQRNPETGFLRVQVFAANQAFPIPNATVVVSKRFPNKECVFFRTQTDASGIMSRITLPAPDRQLADAPSALQPYATYDIVVTHPLFTKVHLTDVAVFDSVETVQNVEMVPCIPDFDPAMLTIEEG